MITFRSHCVHFLSSFACVNLFLPLEIIRVFCRIITFILSQQTHPSIYYLPGAERMVRRFTGQEISCPPWNLMIHYCVLRNSSLDPVLANLNRVHASHPIFWRLLLLLSFHLRLRLSRGLLFSGSSTKILDNLSSRYFFKIKIQQFSFAFVKTRVAVPYWTRITIKDIAPWPRRAKQLMCDAKSIFDVRIIGRE
jgi:hypothetical protein